MGDGRVMVSHLQFTDDTILFLNAKSHNIGRMERCLKIFKLIFGLKVNLEKSILVGIHVDHPSLVEFADIIGCKVGSWPLFYLGMPLGVNPWSNAMWDPMLESVSKKLAMWKKNYISLGGRITLIKAAMANIPLYYMLLFKILAKVMLKIEKF